MKYLLRLSYLGTAYAGFQVQKNANTVQARLSYAAKTVFNTDCTVTGCSRTDSGVHALEYYATLAEKDGSVIAEEKIPRALCAYLPDDISVSEAKLVDGGFSVRRAVSGKEYMYLLWTGKSRNPFYSDRAYYYPHTADTDKMNEAAAHFIGKHDFAAFMASGSEITDTVRTVSDCRVVSDGDFLKIFVSADGFLYNMVRIIVGTLLGVSEGKIQPSGIGDIILSRKRENAGRTAPPEGLYLNRVFLK